MVCDTETHHKGDNNQMDIVFTPIDDELPVLLVQDKHYACPQCGTELKLKSISTQPEILFHYGCSDGHEAIVEAQYRHVKLPRVGVN